MIQWKTLRAPLAALALAVAATVVIPAGEAFAQATCRTKCTEEENACLSRTGNKSQCGGKAQTCMAKCK
ncbi:MAG: hypothetical protein IPK81_19945 [Rhodospirillales bacterium]|nr:MAG: hypothetical protein IPK81_19945 [Rhodospirillales bacterium]